MKKRKFKILIPEVLPPEDVTTNILKPLAEIKVGPDQPYSEEELIKEIRDMNAILVTSREHITRKVISAAKNLIVIGKYGVGIENIDIKAATERGIPVTYSPGINADTVAEHAIALMLALLRRIPLAMACLKAGRWRGKELLGDELTGSTVGIVGLGRIGSKVATKLKGFDVKILAHDPYFQEERASELGVTIKNLMSLLSESDIVTLHVQLTSETRHLIGQRELRSMKRSAYLVNTSRGPVVNEDALYMALKEGWIAGAALDVFEKEPPAPRNPLFQFDNAIFTPHIGGSTRKTRRKTVFQAADNVAKILRGELPPKENIANPEILGRDSSSFYSKSS